MGSEFRSRFRSLLAPTRSAMLNQSYRKRGWKSSGAATIALPLACLWPGDGARQLVSMSESVRDLGPIRLAVKVDADPPAGPEVWRREVTRRRAPDQQGLSDMSGIAPDGVTTRAVMIVSVCTAGKHLLADPECRLAVGSFFPCHGWTP